MIAERWCERLHWFSSFLQHLLWACSTAFCQSCCRDLLLWNYCIVIGPDKNGESGHAMVGGEEVEEVLKSLLWEFQYSVFIENSLVLLVAFIAVWWIDRHGCSIFHSRKFSVVWLPQISGLSQSWSCSLSYWWEENVSWEVKKTANNQPDTPPYSELLFSVHCFSFDCTTFHLWNLPVLPNFKFFPQLLKNFVI